MATTERLFQFTSKPSPVPADIIYIGDSADSFNEVNSTIAQVIGAYPTLLGIGGLTLGNNSYPYVNNSGNYTAGTISALGVSLIAQTTAAAFFTALTLNPATAGSGAVIVSNGTNFIGSLITGITAVGTQSQALNMGGFQINAMAAPTVSTDAATKGYVDSVALGGGAPVYAATTGALTVTQAGAGVGATLTNAGSQATFALDGATPPLNSRVLIKNQSSNTQNGVYTVTNVGSNSTNWILTRAVDYDTPTDINDTGAIPVENGAVNAGTGWINTTIMVTVDTTAVTFIQSGATPVSGTFTPTFLPNSGSFGAITYVTQSGEYTKIGNVVYFSIALVLSAFTVGTATGSILFVTGVPFAPKASSNASISLTVANFTYTGQLVASTLAGGTGIAIIFQEQASASSTTNIDCDALAATSTVLCSGFYFTS